MDDPKDRDSTFIEQINDPIASVHNLTRVNVMKLRDSAPEARNDL
jgi:hypothetical protein